MGIVNGGAYISPTSLPHTYAFILQGRGKLASAGVRRLYESHELAYPGETLP